MSPVIDIENTYYILMVERETKRNVKPIGDVRDEIEKNLIQQERMKAQQRWLETLRKRHTSRYYPEADVRVGITCGDPAGVGPEIVRAALESGNLPLMSSTCVIGATDAFRAGRPERASAATRFTPWRRRSILQDRERFRPSLPARFPRKRCMKPDLRFPARPNFSRSGAASAISQCA